MKFFLSLFIASLSLFFVACGTPGKDLGRVVATGMDKAAVLEAAGNPDKSDRAHGLDRWVYLPGTDKNSSAEAVYVFFSAGKVEYVGPRYPAKQRATPRPGVAPGEFKDLNE